MSNSTKVVNTTPMPTKEEIANIITDFKVSDMVIDAAEMAFMELFVSETFCDSSREYREDITFNYKLLMDVLRKIAKVERIQFSIN